MKIALFGTSADPPTMAHQSILQWLATHYDQVLIWAADNPFKAQQTDLTHRMAMLKRLMAAMPYENLQVSPDLSDRRSLISLERAKTIWGNQACYTLVIGSDLVRQIPRWYQVETLLQSVTLLIFPRPGYPLHPPDLQTLSQLGGRYDIVQVELPAIASTHFRVHQDASILPPAVQDYIEQEKLYLS